MTDWTGTAHSNYFAVKDLEAFEVAIKPYELTIKTGVGAEAGRVALVEDHYGTGWPITAGCDDYVPDPDTPDANGDPSCGSCCGPKHESRTLYQVVASHLQEGYVAVFAEVGSEGDRYPMAWALAINPAGQTVTLDLDEIFDRALALAAPDK